MKKILLPFLLLPVLLISSYASERTTPVVDSLNQGSENLQVTITTGTPIDVLSVLASTTTAGTTASKAYRFVKVDNLDGSFSVFCSNRSTVEVSGTNIGDEIKPGKWKLWILKPRQPWYCISDQTTVAGSSSLITAGR